MLLRGLSDLFEVTVPAEVIHIDAVAASPTSDFSSACSSCSEDSNQSYQLPQPQGGNGHDGGDNSDDDPQEGSSRTRPASDDADDDDMDDDNNDDDDDGDDDDHEDADDDDDDVDVDDAMDMEDVGAKKAKQNENLQAEHAKVLECLKATQRKEYMKGTMAGSIQATDRLMKELKDIYMSPSFKSGAYTVELVNDSLYEWNVKIHRVDPDSSLAEDLIKLKEKEGTDHILMSFTFKDTFPFDPPFVRMIYPVLNGGYVLDGGALCMELMTPQGWSSAYTIEAVIMQLSATLVKGKARIRFDAPKGTYNLARAQQSFRSLVHIHEKNGWFTPPKSDG